MRIYHDISDAKLDMLAAQIAEPFWKKLSASLNIEVSFVKAACAPVPCVVMPAAGCALRAGTSDLERAAVRSNFEGVRVR